MLLLCTHRAHLLVYIFVFEDCENVFTRDGFVRIEQKESNQILQNEILNS